MDQNPLVSEQRDAGERVAEACLAAGIDVTAAFWAKPSEDGQWCFYLASRAVDDRGLAAAYRDVLEAIGSMEPTAEMDTLADLKLIGASNPIARDVVDIQNRFPAPLATHYRGNRLGSLTIDEAYLYRPRQTPANPV